MQKLRAEEIAQSPDMKNVIYNGKPVYIQHVNNNNETARVFLLDNPEQEFDAQLSRLFEK
ncbi:H-type small acid-soluble spore protein [Ornithinibacillus sp. L9]|uniref:Small, acid-soluble spore protein H n=1 Tax=Ornithinibacillus caprae TaxID=2678566 RepID=A0A6N8FIN0_9BACI|nr:H-type small acid-soluble spore protein [Ornithinibacillus caprae]MUK88536.1 H-type small acid-soluble spore protein [Ornithinibacillus caprae]